jgi:hypothetical protein
MTEIRMTNERKFQVSGSKFQEGSGGVLEWWGLGT